MRRKIFLFNVTLLTYLMSLSVANGQSSTDPFPDGVLTRLQHGGSVYTVAFSPNGRTLASGGDDNTVILWDVTNGLELKTFAEHTDWVKCVAFSPDGQILASASMDGSVKLWPVSADGSSSTLKLGDWVESVAFSPDGRTLATSGNMNGSIELWDVSGIYANRIEPIVGHRSGVSSIAFSPNGLLLASAGDDDTVRLWDVVDRSEVKSITEHSSDVHSVVFSPDGKILASGSKDDTIKLLKVPSGKILTVLEHDYVESVAFSPDGQTLASASADYTIKLWSMSSESERVSLKGHRNGVTSVVFAPDGQTLASSSRDGIVLVWNLSHFGIESTPIPDLPEKPDVLEVEKLENPSVIVSSDEPELPIDVPEELDSPKIAGSDDLSITVLPEEPKPSVPESENLLPRRDTTPPNIVIYSSVKRIVNATVNQVLIEVNVTDDSGVAEVLISDRKADVSGSDVFSTTVPLNQGKNEIRITATDASGNVGTHQFSILRGKPNHVDTAPPNIVIHSPMERIVNLTVNQVPVKVGVTDDSMVAEVWIKGIKATVSETGAFTAAIPLDFGENEIRVVATDTYGHMSTDLFTVYRQEYNVEKDIEGPEIRIHSPAAHLTRGVQAKIRLTEAFTRVSGIVTDPSGVSKVKVNGTEARVMGNDFNTTISLTYGDNLIRVTAIDTLGNESDKQIAVVRERYVRKGQDYALLFAVDDYDHWPDLMSPHFDAQAILLDLQNFYGFQVELIRNPTREGILEALLRYAARQYTDEDQLLIFFAGHGHFNPGFKEGYLVAQDTKQPIGDITMGSYLSHSEFRNIINRMSCKHIFLVLDTCYSGTFDQQIAMRGEAEDVFRPISYADVEEKLKYTTRWYLTSGGKEQVPDGGRGHSPFAHEFLEALRSKGGIDNILTIDEVLGYLEKLDDPKPRASGFGSNEPGSDFLFIKK